ncbi:MAG TPA: T9SS type A sorting domain-containing protein [Cytophagaceae bacterium]|jgi:hypothetical protein|nr:T9SS type A sorting domain-containing protein [Cytophagaceae bacterium]
MKKNLQKRLGIYSVAAGAMALGMQEGNAQIVYNNFTDITFTSTGNTVDSLDLNSDGINDFGIKYGGSNLLYILPKTGNSVLDNSPTNPSKIFLLAANAPIGASPVTGQAWWSTSAFSTNSGGIDKYIGLAIKKAGVFYYGWIRVNIATNNVKIYDGAYNSTAGSPILAAQQSGTTGIVSAGVASGTNVFVNDNKEIVIRRENDALTQSGAVDVISMNGTVIASKVLDGTETSIPVSDQTGSIYIVRVSYESGVVNKKVALR